MFFRVYSNSMYKTDVINKRKNAILEEMNKKRLIMFPNRQNPKEVRRFIIHKLEQAEECIDTDSQQAADHMAEAVFMLTRQETNCLLKRLSYTMSSQMYNLLVTKHKELRDYMTLTHCRTKMMQKKISNFNECKHAKKQKELKKYSDDKNLTNKTDSQVTFVKPQYSKSDQRMTPSNQICASKGPD